MAVSAVLQVSLSLMFAAAGGFAVAVIVSSWRKAAPAIAVLAREIALLESAEQPRREVRFRIAAIANPATPPRLRVVSVRPPSGPALAPATGLRAAA